MIKTQPSAVHTHVVV